MPKLENERHEKFCRYAVTMNQTRAYLKVYPDSSYDAARVSASELLAKPNVADRLAELKEIAAKKAEVTREMVIAELKALAFTDASEIMDDNWDVKPKDQLTKAQRKSIASVEVSEMKLDEAVTKKQVKIKLIDKLAALEKLARHLGLYEADNKQKAPQINLHELSTEELIKRAEAIEKLEDNS